MSLLLILGITAGLLQLLGYYLYLTDEHIDPNPVTWFMFAYGTAILTVLEWDKEATLAELILPIVCAILAIAVSIKCWKKARNLNPLKWWPEDWWPEDYYEQASFIADIIITLGYVFVWILTISMILSPSQKELGVFMFLFLSNVSTLPSFYPILNTTFKNPEKESWAPWIIWAVAYSILGFVTYSTHGEFWHILMFYPVSNAILHALVGFVSIKHIRDKIYNLFVNLAVVNKYK